MANIIGRISHAIFGSKNKYVRAFYSLMSNAFAEYDPNDPTYIEKGYQENPDVFSIVKDKSNQFNRIPYHIKRVKDKESKSRHDQLRTFYGEPSIEVKRAIYGKKAFEERELPLPLDRPNVLTTWREFFAMYSTFMDLTGNFYMYMQRPKEGANAGRPIQVYVLPSHQMEIVLKDGISNEDVVMGMESPIDYYMLRDGEQYVEFPAEDVIHVKAPNPDYSSTGRQLYGQSPLRAVLKNIQSSNEALSLNAKTLANGGVFGFLSTKDPLTPEQAQQLKDRLVEMDNSPKRLSNIAGSAKEVVFTRISLTTDELQPFEYLKHDQKAIANALGWDDKLLNSDDGAKYDNYKIAVQRAITSGIVPNIRLLEEAFNTEFLPLFKEYKGAVWCWDEGELPEMQADLKTMTEWLNNAWDRGIIVGDEYREALGYPKTGKPEMNTHLVSMNVIPIEEAVIPDSEFNIDGNTDAV